VTGREPGIVPKPLRKIAIQLSRHDEPGRRAQTLGG